MSTSGNKCQLQTGGVRKLKKCRKSIILDSAVEHIAQLFGKSKSGLAARAINCGIYTRIIAVGKSESLSVCQIFCVQALEVVFADSISKSTISDEAPR